MDEQQIVEAQDDRKTQHELTVTNVYKSYRRGVFGKGAAVLTGASLTVGSGEVVGLVGENGSGKTTLMRIIAGSLRADSGTVNIRGQLGYTPQRPLLYESLTPDEHFDLFGSAYRMDDATIQARRDELYEQFGFTRYRNARVDSLSGGSASKLNLSLALLPQPDLILLDEPYAGFDWDTYLKFWNIVAEHRERGAAVLVITHFAADQERFDRILNLIDGKVTE